MTEASLLPPVALPGSSARAPSGNGAAMPANTEAMVGVAQTSHRALALRIALAASVLAVLWVFWGYAGWLLLAAWFASLARPTLDRLTDPGRRRRRGAALMTVALCFVVLAPIALVVAALAVDAIALVHSILHAESGRVALQNLVSESAAAQGPSTEAPTAVTSIAAFVRAHSEPALALLGAALGSVVQGVLGFMVLFAGAFTLLADGPGLFSWLEGIAPVSQSSMRRLRDAFIETGRGLAIGSGLTGLVQASIATVIYFALDVPRAMVLGFLTLVSSVIPGIGTTLVWVPVAIGLALTGRVPAAITVATLSLVFVAGIDNVIRPFFVRWGKLELSPFVVMVSVFGGVAAAGPWGILVGPLVLRLALEVLRICRDERVL